VVGVKFLSQNKSAAPTRSWHAEPRRPEPMTREPDFTSLQCFEKKYPAIHSTTSTAFSVTHHGNLLPMTFCHVLWIMDWLFYHIEAGFSH
jgi:hypothetical protein